MNKSLTHLAPAAHLISEVPGMDRIHGRSHAELADAMTFCAWYAPGIFRAVMDYMDTLDGELIPAAM